MKLRIKFRKYGAIRFIGHLDVMRFFQKAIRRARIDVAYTAGFSPHQVMTFAAPLGVGLTSNGEYMDIEVHSIVSCQDVLERLNAASVPGIEIVSVKILPEGTGNAMASVAAAAYTVSFRENRRPKVDFAAALPDFLAQEQILITKETKRGTREVDLKQGIYSLEYMEEGDPSAGTLVMLLDASSGGNIKPAQVVAAILSHSGETLQENALRIVREDVYTNMGAEGERRLVSLGEIGHSDFNDSGCSDLHNSECLSGDCNAAENFAEEKP